MTMSKLVEKRLEDVCGGSIVVTYVDIRVCLLQVTCSRQKYLPDAILCTLHHEFKSQ